MEDIKHALHLLNPSILSIIIDNPNQITIKKTFKSLRLANATILPIGRHFAKICKRRIKVKSTFHSPSGEVKNLTSFTCPRDDYINAGSQVVDTQKKDK